jgi:hypothetical protein
MRVSWLFHLLLAWALVLAPSLPRTIAPIVDPSEEEHKEQSKEQTESSKSAEKRHDALVRRFHAGAHRPQSRRLSQLGRATERLLIARTVDARVHRAGISERRLI